MDEDAEKFVLMGRDRLTALSNAIRQLSDWAGAFGQRGGMEVFGNDAALIAGINLKVQTAIDEADLATLARLRTDV